MYSYEVRMRAVELYIKLGKRVRAICGYAHSQPIAPPERSIRPALRASR